MAGRRVVKRGESTASIALEEGLFPDTIWDHPENAALRARRENMNVLAPGDELFVPDKRIRHETRAADRRHRFRRRGVPDQLVLVIQDEAGPRAGLAYTLEVGAQRFEGQTDGDGRIRHWVSPRARRAVLTCGGARRVLEIGTMPPVDLEEGVAARLENLGYLLTERSDEAEVSGALAAFQRAQGLPETGEADEATRSRLRTVHGS